MKKSITNNNTKRYLDVILIIAVFLLIANCNKENHLTGNSYRIHSLIELVDNTEIDRTDEIKGCRLDDRFFFQENMDITIQMNNNICDGDPLESISGIWSEIESGELLELRLPFGYILHDSLILSLTRDQWRNGERQYYKIIEFKEEKIVLQNQMMNSEPQTQNTWQLELRTNM